MSTCTARCSGCSFFVCMHMYAHVKHTCLCSVCSCVFFFLWILQLQRIVTKENVNCRDTTGRNSTPLHLAGKTRRLWCWNPWVKTCVSMFGIPCEHAFCKILSELNQAAPGHLTDERVERVSQIHHQTILIAMPSLSPAFSNCTFCFVLFTACSWLQPTGGGWVASWVWCGRQRQGQRWFDSSSQCIVLRGESLSLSPHSLCHVMDSLRFTPWKLIQRHSCWMHLNVYINFDPGMVGKGVLAGGMTSLRKRSIAFFQNIPAHQSQCWYICKTFRSDISPASSVTNWWKNSNYRYRERGLYGFNRHKPWKHLVPISYQFLKKLSTVYCIFRSCRWQQFGTEKLTIWCHWSHFLKLHQMMSDSLFHYPKSVCVLTPRQCGLWHHWSHFMNLHLMMPLITLNELASNDVRQSISLCQDCMCTHTQTIWSSYSTDHTSWTCIRWCQTVYFTIPRVYVYSHPDNVVSDITDHTSWTCIWWCHWSHLMNLHQMMSDSLFHCAKIVCVLTPRQYGPLTALITLHELASDDVRQFSSLSQTEYCSMY